MNKNEALMLACEKLGLKYHEIAKRGKPSPQGKQARELAAKIFAETAEGKMHAQIKDEYENKYAHLQYFDSTKQKPLHTFSKEEMANTELIIPEFLKKGK